MMRIPRIFNAAAIRAGQSLNLTEQAQRHITQVLRLKAGSALILFDGRGGEYQATLTRVTRHEAIAEVGQHFASECESPLDITLAQGVSRGERMDLTLQKATELGVTAITPLLTERCGVRLSGERLDKKHSHWHGVVVSACEQCGRNRLPAIHSLCSLPNWLTTSDMAGSLCLVLSPEAGQPLNALPPPANNAVTLLVGPEGGLSNNETELAVQQGFQPVRLGPRILRTETAGLAGLAILQALWGDLGQG